MIDTAGDANRHPMLFAFTRIFWTLWLPVALTGCVSTQFVQYELEDRMRGADYEGAVAVVDEEASGAFAGKNRLLYFLERGMLLHVDGRHQESNEAFARAKRLAKELEARSVSASTLSILSNDRVIDYGGEDFERILIHLFSALNYQQLGEVESALVEARQVANSLRELSRASSGQRVYRDDAFARYLSAMLFESEGDLSRALTDYKLALAAYRRYERDYGVAAPEMLASHASQLAARLGEWALADLSEFVEPPVGVARKRVRTTGREGFGEIIVLHYNGLSPVKREDRFVIPVSEAWAHATALQATASPDEREEIARAFAFLSRSPRGDFIPIAFPRFESRRYSISQMAPRVAGALQVTEPDLVEDIGAIAFEDLEDRIAKVQAKAIVRAAIKWGVQKAVEARVAESLRGHDGQGWDDGRGRGELMRALVVAGGNAARFATERADERMWSTLPDTIWMSSIVVKEGKHDLQVDFLDHDRRVIEEQTIRDVEVASGARRFVIVRTVQ